MQGTRLKLEGISGAKLNEEALEIDRVGLQEMLAHLSSVRNPDQIAGGDPLNIGGMGNKRINSSIGSQWKYRVDIVDEQIGELAKLMTSEQRKNTYLNVKLTH